MYQSPGPIKEQNCEIKQVINVIIMMSNMSFSDIKPATDINNNACAKLNLQVLVDVEQQTPTQRCTAVGPDNFYLVP